MSVRTLALAACAAALALAASPALAQQFPDITPRPQQGDVKVGTVQRYQLRPNVYMYVGPTGNTVVFTGEDGVLVIDPQGGAASQDLIGDIGRLSAKPIRWLINTSADDAHVAGNKAVAQAGVSLEGGNVRPAGVAPNAEGAKIYSHEGVAQRLSTGDSDPAGWPTDTYFVALKDFYINGEAVQLMSAPAAHATGDSIVFIRSSDVIAAGDVYTPDRYPQIDLEHGGSIQGVLDGLNHLVQLAVPAFNEEGGTLIAPGHGRIVDEGDLAEYRDMVTIIRDRIKDMIGKRMTLAQIQAAKPSLDYDGVFGAENGARFVETVYRSLTSGQATKRR